MNPIALIKGAVALWQMWSAFRKKIPAELRQAAKEAVASAKVLDHLPDHAARREWAVSFLQKRGFKENQARLAVEAAVAAVSK
jgi:hypothetical protein